MIERKIRDGQVLYMAVSGDRIVTSSDDGTFSSGHHVIQVFNVSTCLLVLSPYMLFLAMSYVTVERIKQFPDEHVRCHCLSARGDVVYIGGVRCSIQWNMITDSVEKLEGYHGLILQLFCHA